MIPWPPRRPILALLACLVAPPLPAFTLDLPPDAEETASRTESGAQALPSGPFRDGAIPRRRADGPVRRTAWRVPGSGPAPLVEALEAQIAEAGYRTVYVCRAVECGGYDFRFGIETLPAPAMFVDLGDYGYFLAEGPDGALLSLLSSRAGGDGYVQMTVAGVETAAATPDAPDAPDVGAAIWDELEANGHAVLGDLLFATGSAELASPRTETLDQVAEGLGARPDARVALVGHTDATGALGPNLDLSRRRAEAVRRALIAEYGVAPDRLEAEGVGYLAPRSASSSAEGRRANRRVEVVLTR